MRRALHLHPALLATLALVAAFLFAPRALADRPGGVTAQTLKAPSGPASLTGLGESFSPNISTGTGAYRVPIAVPPGFVSPDVALQYLAGSGQGVAGMSFDMPLLHIYRTRDKGAPAFDEDDRFAVSGGSLNDELVLVNEKLRYYRLKNEGAFALFVRNAEDNSWEIRLPGGERAYLGTSLPGRETSRGRAYKWFLQTQKDQFGHRTEYTYQNDEGKLYLSSIRYQLHAPGYENEIAFAYESRPDTTTSYAYGAAVTTGLRLKTIRVHHAARTIRTYQLAYERSRLFSLLREVTLYGEGCQDLGDGQMGGANCPNETMPTLSFGYLRDRDESLALVTMQQTPPLESLIDGSGELEDVNADGLPDLLVARASDYRYYENIDGTNWARGATEVQNSPDRSLYDAGTVLADINGDGFRDLIHPQGDHFRYYPAGNVERGKFIGYGAPVTLETQSGGFDFSAQIVKMTDLNSDGRIDLLWQKPGRDARVMNDEDDVLREKFVPEFPIDIDFTDQRVMLTDWNGDGELDFVLNQLGFDSSRIRVWYGLGHGEFTTERAMLGVPQGDASEFHFEDVNRDGQTDLVRVSGSWATYYLNTGTGRFTGPRGDFRGLPAQANTQKLLFADMNGNGSRDIVWITTDFKLRYLDMVGEPNAALLSSVDNGMGLVTEIAYRSSVEFAVEAKKAGKPWLFPMPNPVPVLSEIHTTDSLDLVGSGFRSTDSWTTYEYRDGYFDGKEREFRGFETVTTTSWGDAEDADGAGHESLVTETRMHVGKNLVTGEDEEILKGKPYAEITKTGSGDIFASVETKWEQRLLCQEDLGLSLGILPRCDQMGDLEDKKDELVTFAVTTDTLTATYEQGQTPFFTAASQQYDAWGREIQKQVYGRVGYLGMYTPGNGFDPKNIEPAGGARADEGTIADEQATETTSLYEVSETSWLIGLPYGSKLTSLEGTLYAATQTFYDGKSLGSADKGKVTRVRRCNVDLGCGQGGAGWQDTEFHSYDSHGNRTETKNAVGDKVSLDYEAPFILPTAERIDLGGGNEVAFSASYDLAFGAMQALRDANGHPWAFVNDGLGRVTGIYDPLSLAGECTGSLESCAPSGLPVSKFQYEYGTPTRPISTTIIDKLVDRSDAANPQYHRTYSYSDGAGRARQEKVQAEAELGGWVSSGWTDLSSRGAATKVYDTFKSKDSSFQHPPTGTPATTSTLDALGRATVVRRPDTTDVQGHSVLTGSQVLSVYEPFLTRAYTERESSIGDLEHPVVTRTDGLGRTILVEKSNTVRPAQSSSGIETAGSGERQELKWRIFYDVRGSIVNFADPKWGGDMSDVRHLRHYAYDGLGRLTKIQDPNAGETEYAFDVLDRLVERTDPLGQIQRWQYGKAGRLLSHVVEADVYGNPEYEHRYHYDTPAAGTPIRSAAPNLWGQLSWLEFPTGQEHFAYDSLGRSNEQVTKLWNPETSNFDSQKRDDFRREIDYRADGQVTEVRAPGGMVLRSEYNARGGLRSLSGALGAAPARFIAENVTYDQRGAEVSTLAGNRVQACKRYNERAELTGFAAGLDVTCESSSSIGELGTGFHHLVYARGYDALIDGIVDLSAPSQDTGLPRLDAAYEYDAIHQLTRVSDVRGSTEFSYDEIQNLVRRDIFEDIQDRPTGDFGYGEDGAGPNAITSAGGKLYSYDAAGQLESYNGYQLRFDAEGRLVEAYNSTTTRRLVQHYDDAGERRIAITYRESKDAEGEPKTVTEVHRFVAPDYQIRDGEEMWFSGAGSVGVEIVKSQGVQVDFTLLDQLTAYTVGTEPAPKPLPEEYLDLARDGGGFGETDLALADEGFREEERVGGARTVWRYVTTDHLGGTTHVTDSAGELVSHQRFHPYGKVASRLGVLPQRGYIGKDIEADRELGLLRFGARWYAPDLGRFVTPDPLIGQSPGLMAGRVLESNLYSYAINNPIMGKDPSGLTCGADESCEVIASSEDGGSVYSDGTVRDPTTDEGSWGYQVHVRVDVPGRGGEVGGDRADGTDFGHAYVVLESPEGQKAYGLYPSELPIFPSDFKSGSAGIVKTNESTPSELDHEYELEATFELTPEEFEAVQSYSERSNASPPSWSSSFACTDFAIAACARAGVDIAIDPATTTVNSTFGWESTTRWPQDLAVELKNEHGGVEAVGGTQGGSSSSKKAEEQ